MSYLIDIDIISAHLRGSGIVTNRFLQYTGRLYVSVVTLVELKVWTFVSKRQIDTAKGSIS